MPAPVPRSVAEGCSLRIMLGRLQLTFEPYTGMSDLMISMVSDVVMNDITRAMMTSPVVIQTIPNSFPCIERGTRSPYLRKASNKKAIPESN